ncbi:uncharacterized protein LOC104856498 [Fukomys damarensis]|uniref:uncharacterized protein LOC104856498 n=1 Tax=Fukomys damarensis TaxID=885580 RepID=UPI00053F9B66|nr:uncharacterized protein LOC104856498 [Fukomys damarensis]
MGGRAEAGLGAPCWPVWAGRRICGDFMHVAVPWEQRAATSQVHSPGSSLASKAAPRPSGLGTVESSFLDKARPLALPRDKGQRGGRGLEAEPLCPPLPPFLGPGHPKWISAAVLQKVLCWLGSSEPAISWDVTRGASSVSLTEGPGLPGASELQAADLCAPDGGQGLHDPTLQAAGTVSGPAPGRVKDPKLLAQPLGVTPAVLCEVSGAPDTTGPSLMLRVWQFLS